MVQNTQRISQFCTVVILQCCCWEIWIRSLILVYKPVSPYLKLMFLCLGVSCSCREMRPPVGLFLSIVCGGHFQSDSGVSSENVLEDFLLSYSPFHFSSAVMLLNVGLPVLVFWFYLFSPVFPLCLLWCVGCVCTPACCLVCVCCSVFMEDFSEDCPSSSYLFSLSYHIFIF